MVRRTSFILLIGSLLVLLAPGVSAGGGCHSAAAATAGRADGRVTVDIQECAFSPTILYLKPGSEVTWVNRDPVPHTVTGIGLSLAGEKQFNQGKGTGPFRFDEAGVYPYYCILHPGMAGAVVVGDVGAEGAAADEVQSVPLAVPNTNDRPKPPAGGGPANLAAVLTAGAALALAAGLVLAGSRRRRRRPQPAVD